MSSFSFHHYFSLREQLLKGHLQKDLELNDGYEQLIKPHLLGSSEEMQHQTMQDSSHSPFWPPPLLERNKRQDYSLDVSRENRTNTKLRSSEHERDERSRYSTSWYSTKERTWVRVAIEPRWRRYEQNYIVSDIFPGEKETLHRQFVEQQQFKKSELLAAVVNPINGLSASTELRRTEDFSSGETEFYVAGSVNGTVVEALPDTGAEACFISPHLTSRLGLHPTPGPEKWITLANKKTVKSPGMVTVPWKFSKERITHTINCWILPGCIGDLVLGNDFLKATNALKKVCHRIKSKLLGVSKRLSLSYLGNEKHRLRGYLNGYSTAALPDTGSDAMLINRSYARKLGLHIDHNIGDQGTIRLADGSTAMISGIIRDAEWRVGSTTVRCNFYVLDNLCVDVILSKNYLFGKNIFSEQEEHFFDVKSGDDSEDDHKDGYEDNSLHFCILSIDTKVHDSGLTLQERKEREQIEELYRRDRARDELMASPEDKREAATKIENARQQLWETQKSEREAKWIAEVHMATANVQHGVSRGSRWKKRISIGFFSKGNKAITHTRPNGISHTNRASSGGN
ncbi:hypothetical protein V8C40DRAFT_248221 [Trichoderma camerunense]